MKKEEDDTGRWSQDAVIYEVQLDNIGDFTCSVKQLQGAIGNA